MANTELRPFGLEYLEPMLEHNPEAAFGGIQPHPTCTDVHGTTGCDAGGDPSLDDPYCECQYDS